MTRPLQAPELVAAAERAQREFGLCDACLGRRFGKVETGLTNPERARVIGLSPVALADCFVCRGLMGELDALAEVAVETLAPYEHGNFLVGTRLDPVVEAREAEVNAALALGDKTERMQAEMNREVGKRVSARTGKPVEFKQPEITVIVDSRFFDAELQFGALYVFGRYLKHDRTIPQTKWPCNRCGGRGCHQCGMTGQQYSGSVEAFVAAPFAAATGATQGSFHGAGREDIDARCLGDGRPFVLELNDPRRRRIDLLSMPDRVRAASGGRVEVRELRFTTKAEVAHVKDHGGSKTYRARVALGAPVDAKALEEAARTLHGATVKQRTPQRVEHRRADLVRERRVIGIVVEEHAGDRATLRIHGDAGLYIKELVSGDEGRTDPSLAGLLSVAAKVEELDVVGVEYEPPAERLPPGQGI